MLEPMHPDTFDSLRPFLNEEEKVLLNNQAKQLIVRNSLMGLSALGIGVAIIFLIICSVLQWWWGALISLSAIPCFVLYIKYAWRKMMGFEMFIKSLRNKYAK